MIFTNFPFSDRLGKAYLAIANPQNTILTIPEYPKAYAIR